jgi:hypothetical protein
MDWVFFIKMLLCTEIIVSKFLLTMLFCRLLPPTSRPTKGAKHSFLNKFWLHMQLMGHGGLFTNDYNLKSIHIGG